MKGERRKCKKCNNIFLEKRGNMLCTKKKNGLFETKKDSFITLYIKENKKSKNNVNKLRKKKIKL